METKGYNNAFAYIISEITYNEDLYTVPSLEIKFPLDDLSVLHNLIEIFNVDATKVISLNTYHHTTPKKTLDRDKLIALFPNLQTIEDGALYGL